MEIVKYVLTRIGERCSKPTIHRFNATLNYLEVGRWMNDHGLACGDRLDAREEVFDRIAELIAKMHGCGE